MDEFTFADLLGALTDRDLERLRERVVAEQQRRVDKGVFQFSCAEPHFDRPDMFGEETPSASAEKPSDR